MQKRIIINIGRQLGSGGKLIGKKLAERLEISFYDKELITMASQESGLGKNLFEKIDEKAGHSLLGGLLGLRGSLVHDTFSNYYLSNETLFKIQSDVIRQLAEKNSSLFVGRCADYILKENPNCLNIFFCADKNDRVKRISHIKQLAPEKAMDLIEKTDKKRADYYNYFTNKTWGIAQSYHLCINSSVLGIEETVSFIQQFVIKKFGL